MDLSRRHVLKLGGVALAGTAVRPSHARGQTPKRGGTLALRTWDPPHFDPLQTISYKTHIALSFTHSRLDRKSTRLNSSHSQISYAVFCLKKKKNKTNQYARINLASKHARR